MTAREGIRVENKATITKREISLQVTARLGETNLSGSGQLLTCKSGHMLFACWQHTAALYSATHASRLFCSALYPA